MEEAYPRDWRICRIVAAIPNHFILCSIEDTCSVLISDISLMLWVYTTGFKSQAA